MENRKEIWGDASVPGLVLGLIPIACSLIQQYLVPVIPSGALSGLLNGLVWLGKLIGCILFFKYAMEKFASGTEGVTNSDTFAFGVVTALYSAFIVAAFGFIQISLMGPETLQGIIDTALEQYSTMLDSNSREALDQIMPSLPGITFFSSLIYCLIWGVVLSAIYSRSIPGNNPFNE